MYRLIGAANLVRTVSPGGRLQAVGTVTGKGDAVKVGNQDLWRHSHCASPEMMVTVSLSYLARYLATTQKRWDGEAS
jgi:hypothetical protein